MNLSKHEVGKGSRQAAVRSDLVAELERESIFSPDLITSLVEILEEIIFISIESCLNRGVDKRDVAKRAARPTREQEVRLRIAIRREVFNGSRRRYRRENGKQILKATLRAATKNSEESVAGYVDDIDTQRAGNEWVI